MKKLIIKIWYLVFTIGLITACNDNSIVEFVEETENESVEIISSGDYLNKSSLDSTGTTEFDEENYSAYFFTNIVKNTIEHSTTTYALCEAAFFDKGNPIIVNGNVIGHRRRKNVGSIYFNEQLANPVPHKKRFLNNGEIQDTVIGDQFRLRFGQNEIHKGGTVYYNQEMEIRLESHGKGARTAGITIPSEITAAINVESFNGKLNKLNCSWNGDNEGTITIYIQGVLKRNEEKFPIYKFLVSDNGEFSISEKYLSNENLSDFDALIITFIRKNEKETTGVTNNKSYVASNSIHNLHLPL